MYGSLRRNKLLHYAAGAAALVAGGVAVRALITKWSRDVRCKQGTQAKAEPNTQKTNKGQECECVTNNNIECNDNKERAVVPYMNAQAIANKEQMLIPSNAAPSTMAAGMQALLLTAPSPIAILHVLCPAFNNASATLQVHRPAVHVNAQQLVLTNLSTSHSHAERAIIPYTSIPAFLNQLIGNKNLRIKMTTNYPAVTYDVRMACSLSRPLSEGTIVQLKDTPEHAHDQETVINDDIGNHIKCGSTADNAVNTNVWATNVWQHTWQPKQAWLPVPTTEPQAPKLALCTTDNTANSTSAMDTFKSYQPTLDIAIVMQRLDRHPKLPSGLSVRVPDIHEQARQLEQEEQYWLQHQVQQQLEEQHLRQMQQQQQQQQQWLLQQTRQAEPRSSWLQYLQYVQSTQPTTHYAPPLQSALPPQQQAQFVQPGQQAEQPLQHTFCTPSSVKQESRPCHHLHRDAFTGHELRYHVVALRLKNSSNWQNIQLGCAWREEKNSTPTRSIKQEGAKVGCFNISNSDVLGYQHTVIQQHQQPPTVVTQANHHVMYNQIDVSTTQTSGLLSGQGWFKHLVTDVKQKDDGSTAVVQKPAAAPPLLPQPMALQTNQHVMQTAGVLSGHGWFKHLAV